MTDRHPDADQAVDEQKRRARRRLVGAVVLALAAAVILPMLLEKEPQPLGEDVSVQIPPVDEGKFVNRLTRKVPGDALPKAESKTEARSPASTAKPDVPNTDAAKTSVSDANAPKAAVEGGAATAPSAPVAQTPPAAAPSKSVADAEQRVLAPTAPKQTPAPDAKANAPDKASPATATEAKTGSPATPAPTVASPAPSLPVADAKSAPSGTFAVQLAAFSDDKGANSLANKLKKAGYATAHVEAVDTSHGKLWRVRVGGFGTRAEAEAARLKLKSEGFNGMVAPAR